MRKREIAVYKKVVKDKYRFYKLWKTLAIVFMCLTAFFSTLYFASGEVFRQTQNNVEIVNENADSNINSVVINN